MKSVLAELLGLTRPLIVLDYETTGTDPSVARICSIGMRRHNPDGTLQAYKTLVNPRVPMPKSASDTHKITQDILDYGCAYCWKRGDEHPLPMCEKFRTIHTFATLAPRLLPVMTDVDFSGYNIDYDLTVAYEEFKRENLEFDYAKSKIIDSLRIEQVLEPRTLSAVYERRTGKKMLDAHDAMADVEATEELLIAQLQFPVVPRTVGEIHDMIWPPDPNKLDREGKFIYLNDVLVFGFGKWKERPVTTRLDYVRWMFGASFSPEVKRICDGILGGTIPTKRP